MNKKQSPDTEETAPPEKSFRLEEAFGALFMGVIGLISISNVVVRYATDVSFAFTEEYSVFLLVALTFVGASLAFATNDHIRVAYFVDRMGPFGRALCGGISIAASMAMFALLVYFGADLTLDEFMYDETTPGLGNPAWMYTIWLPVLSLVILWRILQSTIWKKTRNGR